MKRKLEKVGLVKKGAFESAEILIFKNPNDSKVGLPPLFKVRYVLKEIDLERVSEIKNLTLEYSLIE